MAVPEARAPLAQAQTAAEVALRGALLDAVARDISPHLDADPELTLGMLARLVVPALADWSLVTLVEDDGTLRDLGAAHRDPARQEAASRYAALRLPALAPDSYLYRAVLSGRRELLQADATARVTGTIAPGEARDLFAALAPSAMAIQPLVARGRTVALLTLYSDRSWEPARLEAVAEVATRVALALDNSRVYGRAQAAQAEALHYARRMRLLGEVSELLSATLDLRLAVTELARLVVPDLADWCIVTVNAGPGRDRDLGWAHRDPALQEVLGDYARRQSSR